MNILIDEDVETALKIQSTIEYGIFKPLRGQRGVSKRFVKSLCHRIIDADYLKLFPIIVNEYMEVIDGQHRLEAAKALGLKIYYLLEPGLTYLDAARMNSSRDDWDFGEHLDNFVKNNDDNKHRDYVLIDGFISNHNLTLNRFKYLMSKEQKKIFEEKFTTGEFRIVDDLRSISDKIKKIDEIIHFLDKIVIDNKKFLRTDNFWRALYHFMIKKEIDVEKFKEKLGLKFQSVRQMSGYKDYIQVFTDIYNWKSKNRIS